MNIEKTKEKLKSLTDKELSDLQDLIHNERGNRIQYLSNTTHTPHEQSQALSEFFGQAWIH
jgi:transcription initiation factor IIE alpha subunit